MIKKLFIALGVIALALPILALALTPQFQYDPLGTLTTGLVSYYNMQGNSNDYWGTNNGSDTSMTYGTSYGKVNEGALFNSGHIDFGSAFSYERTQSLSIAGWIYPTTFSAFPEMFDKQTSGGCYNGYGFYLDTTGHVHLELSNCSGSNDLNVETTNSISLNTWYNVAVTYTGNSLPAGITLYINGSPVSMTTVSNSLSGTILTSASTKFGLRASGDAQYAGYMDEFGIWTKALSSAEISELYNSDAGQTMCNGTGGPVCASGGTNPKMSFNWITLNWKPEHFTFA